MIVEISLETAETKGEVLKRLGEALELGGPDGNIPTGTIEGKGWGLNWDALSDSLTELGTGGIWGTSRRFQFPLKLNISGWRRFHATETQEFATLQAILRHTKEYYSKQGMVFGYEFL